MNLLEAFFGSDVVLYERNRNRTKKRAVLTRAFDAQVVEFTTDTMKTIDGFVIRREGKIVYREDLNQRYMMCPGDVLRLDLSNVKITEM